MTWEELKEKAKELGYKLTTRIPHSEPEECLLNEEGFAFYEDGTCEYDCEDDGPLCGCPFAYDRKPEQMLMIMEALKMTIEIHELDITDGLNKTLYDKLKKENKKLKKKLKIVLKALKEIRDNMTQYDIDNGIPCDIAEDTLKQIKELDK